MATDPLSTIGLSMPSDFDTASYESVASRIASLKDTCTIAWPEYAGGWNAIGYRFYACAEYDETFTRSLRQHGKFPPFPERYRQERDLYGFFVSGLSVIESFCYGLFAITSMLRSDRFPIATDSDKKKINPEMVANKLASLFASEEVTQELRTLTGDQHYKEWKDMRNILAHRASPGRHHSVTFTVGKDAEYGPSLWGKLDINEHVTQIRRQWLAERLRELLRATDTFASSQF